MAISFIGGTLSVSAAKPATEDASGYGALTWTEVGKVVTIGELGDTAEDITFDLLKTGRRVHVNGVKDVGDVPVTVEYDSSDAGQTIIKNGNNSNTVHSFRITDPDGENWYFYGLIANRSISQREANQYKGLTFVMRGQSGLTVV